MSGGTSSGSGDANMNLTQLTETDWRQILLSLTPDAIKTLEETLRRVQQMHFELTSGRTSASSAVSTTQSSPPAAVPARSPPASSPTSSTGSSSFTKRLGKTFENGRRNLKQEEVTDLEAHRRAKRRERNRVAAAKCRRRRQDHIDTLQQQVNQLKKSGDALRATLHSLTVEKEQLEGIIRQHGVVMKPDQSTAPTPHPIKLEPVDSGRNSAIAQRPSNLKLVVAPPRPSSLPSVPSPGVMTPLTPFSDLQKLSPSSIRLILGKASATPTLQRLQSINYLNLLSPLFEGSTLFSDSLADFLTPKTFQT